MKTDCGVWLWHMCIVTFQKCRCVSCHFLYQLMEPNHRCQHQVCVRLAVTSSSSVYQKQRKDGNSSVPLPSFGSQTFNIGSSIFIPFSIFDNELRFPKCVVVVTIQCLSAGPSYWSVNIFMYQFRRFECSNHNYHNSELISILWQLQLLEDIKTMSTNSTFRPDCTCVCIWWTFSLSARLLTNGRHYQLGTKYDVTHIWRCVYFYLCVLGFIKCQFIGQTSTEVWVVITCHLLPYMPNSMICSWQRKI